MRGHDANNRQGIDVSHWNGPINWVQVAEQKIDFAYIKATEGQTFTDPMFDVNYKGARDAGLKVGAYHFARFHNEDEALKEAQFFLAAIGSKTMDLPYALDLEDNGGLSKEAFTKAAGAFLNYLHDHGKEGIVYSYPYFIQQNITSGLEHYPLWLANYKTGQPDDVPDWADWAIWQYRSDGSINGINGDVDFNELRADFWPVAPVPATTVYIVKSGDTLSAIALRFHTTVADLVMRNHILNPDHIIPGERILIANEKGQSSVTYTVKPGDTLTSIANNHQTTVSELIRLNNIKNPDLIFPGQRLLIH